MLKMALLVLTLTSDGAVRLTLNDHDSAEDCATSQDVLTQILTEAGVEVLAAKCGETPLRLTPFDHGMGAKDEVHLYRVDLADEGSPYVVTPLAPGARCTAAPPQVYCTRSAQQVIEP